MNLKEIISQGESETIEFKESTGEWKEIIKTISVFTNTKGGNILIGASDKGKIIGVQIGKKTIEALVNKIKENTDPKIFPSISVENIKKQNVILIKVEENKSKPVFAFDRVYKRVGKSTVKASSEEIRKLALEGEKIYWDEQICKGAKLEDINWGFVKNFFIPRYEKFSKKMIIGTPEELLEALGCMKEGKPTNAGILLFGKAPQKFFRNSYIGLARYKGKIEEVKRLDYKEFFANLFHQIDECDKYIKEHIAIMSRLLPHKVEREDIPEYCWFSIRELITNAVCHRDYEDQGSKVIVKTFSDRIEFYNPGGLPKGITPENILIRQYSRNPIIANTLAKVKYIEELGEGWNKIIDEHKSHPLKPKLPKIISDKYSILIILYSVRKKFEKTKMELNERQKRAIGYLRRNEKITNKEYQEINKTTKKTATRDLQELARLEILIKSGRTGRGVHYALNSSYKGDIRGHKGT